MFTNEDFLSYFTELEMMERNMRDLYLEAMKNVKSPEIKKKFEELYIAETEHANIMGGIRQIVIKKSVGE